MFTLDVHVFDLDRHWRQRLTSCFEQLKVAGIGLRRGRVELAREPETGLIAIDLAPEQPSLQCSVLFRTPLDLKGNAGKSGIPFVELFRGARNRLSTLRRLYGEGPLDADFRGQSDRASLVRTLRCDLEYRDIRRRSSRTGAEHGIGGMTGAAEYEGDLGEFLPYLRAAWWTGIGRHTVWGNGVVEIAVRSK